MFSNKNNISFVENRLNFQKNLLRKKLFKKVRHNKRKLLTFLLTNDNFRFVVFFDSFKFLMGC